MSIRIGVITSVYSEENIKKVTQQIEGDCEFIFLPYYSFDQLYSEYQKRCQEFHGLLFSGSISYQYIFSHGSPPSIPYVYIEPSEQDYYQLMLRVLYQNPRLDIRRILVGAPSMIIPWAETLGDETAYPVTSVEPSVNFDFEKQDLYTEYFDLYKQLWTSRQVDFICTRFTNLSPRLTALGIPHALILPSSYSIKRAIATLLDHIKGNRDSDALSAVALIQPAEGCSEEELLALRSQLLIYKKKNNFIFALQNNQQPLTICTTNAVLQQITNHYTHCQLTEYLRDHCTTPFCIGWGVGDSLSTARQNAQRALQEAIKTRELSFLVTNLNILIGPLTTAKSRPLTSKPGLQAAALSKLIGITSTHCQKLLDLQHQRTQLQLTRNELSVLLNVTTRTANRILTRLVQLGAAQVIATEPRASAGRPMSIYLIQLDRLSGT